VNSEYDPSLRLRRRNGRIPPADEQFATDGDLGISSDFSFVYQTRVYARHDG